ncbi:dipeptidase PepE [Xanthomarina sp. GH4-25]|uniref:dipeptidase PepE n=1 Tax=Xanthomarina sp. GH4-25 TaxID=3349335 RepID=UPI000D682931|nr:dipeptidase PepE [Flavobacteriaceae bacterium LYZ1037]
MKNLIIASTSTIHASGYLDYLLDELSLFFKDAKTILFIPYARPSGISYDEYTAKAKKAFHTINKNLKGIHEFENPIKAIEEAEALFTGGGNTFVLLNALYKNRLLAPLQKAIQNGTPYLGTSAGSNICGLTINTTNDMPIVYPPSFKALGLIPFNINPHYLDPISNNKHMGETRETRIKEFHEFNTQPVIGLREGSWLRVTGNSIVLKGDLTARVFEYNKTPFEVKTSTELNHIK